jgi:hypothetical protein
MFTALDRVAMNGDDKITLVDGLSLVRPNDQLRSGSWSHNINGADEGFWSANTKAMMLETLPETKLATCYVVA